MRLNYVTIRHHIFLADYSFQTVNEYIRNHIYGNKPLLNCKIIWNNELYVKITFEHCRNVTVKDMMPDI